jgi:hypothetical protein
VCGSHLDVFARGFGPFRRSGRVSLRRSGADRQSAAANAPSRPRAARVRSISGGDRRCARRRPARLQPRHQHDRQLPARPVDAHRRLLNLLDCGEQQKAAKATEDVTAQAEAKGAGATVAWRSETRPGVSGKSVVTAVDTDGQAGRRCMKVVDVVIIDGEESKMEKRMCKQPPSTRYAKAA